MTGHPTLQRVHLHSIVLPVPNDWSSSSPRVTGTNASSQNLGLKKIIVTMIITRAGHLSEDTVG